jgi:hypothetical protein
MDDRLRVALGLGEMTLQHGRRGPLAELGFEQRRKRQAAGRTPGAGKVALASGSRRPADCAIGARIRHRRRRR